MKPASDADDNLPDDRAYALWFPAANTCELRHEKLPSLGTDDVLVETLYSGISRGTEALVFNGKVPEAEWQRMRAPYMGGDFRFPVKYGYALVGRIAKGPPALLGRHVFSLHPHQSAFVSPSDALSALPDDLPPARAVLSANMETALNIIWDANVLPGDRVAVLGAGVVGALTAFIARGIPGTEVVLVDANAARETLANRLNIDFAKAGTLSGEFDVLINASASGEALSEALALAAFEARIVEASWYGDSLLHLPLGGAFHSKRLSLISSQVGAVPPGRRARWPFARRLAKAMQLLRDDRLDALISGETPFERIVDAYPTVLSDPGTLCHRICYTRNPAHVCS